ncbi:MAG: hypothetical protein AB7V42_03170 [Thermoleophilia bacterium]
MRGGRRWTIAAAIGVSGMLAAAGGAAAQKAPSRIVYECGANLCVIDPDTGRGGALTADGTPERRWWSPSISRDGRRLAAVLAGAARSGPYGGALADYDAKASTFTVDVAVPPTGTAVAWFTSRTERRNSPRCYWTPGGLYCDYLNTTLVTITTVGGFPPNVERGGSAVGFIGAGGLLTVASEPYQVSDPELGEYTSHRDVICTVADPADPDSPCASVIRVDAGRRPVAVTGSPDGRLIAAVVTTTDGTDPVLSLYDAASGAKLRDVAAGALYATFSPDGARIAYEGGDGAIHVAPTGGGPGRRLTAGGHPSWGLGEAVTAKGASLSATAPLRYRGGRIGVPLRCESAAACRGTLRLLAGRRVVATTRYSLKAGRTATLRVRPTVAGAGRLARGRTHRLTLRLAPAGGKATTRAVTVGR